MRIAMLSDVHGNRPAFEAVLDAIEEAAVEELWCLGDLVGYGAEPDDCVGLYHASPRDPVWEYVLTPWQADECLDLAKARVCAVGHSHVALWFQRDPAGKVDGAQAAADLERDLSQGEWLVNPGGVGQARDGDPPAAWLLLDTGSLAATWKRVEYPIDEAATAIEEAGLPRVLAERLYSGQGRPSSAQPYFW